MPDRLDNGHVLTDEDVDTAQLIKQLNDRLGRPTDDLTLRIAATPRARVRQVARRRAHKLPSPGGSARRPTERRSSADRSAVGGRRTSRTQ